MKQNANEWASVDKLRRRRKYKRSMNSPSRVAKKSSLNNVVEQPKKIKKVGFWKRLAKYLFTFRIK